MRKNTVQPDRPQITIQHKACALRAGYLRLQTHTQNIYYLLLFHSNNGYANEPQCYVVRTLPAVFAIIFSGNPLMSVFKLGKYSNNNNVSYKNEITGKLANYVVPRVNVQTEITGASQNLKFANVYFRRYRAQRRKKRANKC
jgi:hypothetical protein